jgi:uncharacterized membrane protein YbhN (UPF0104 family)
LDSAAPTRAPRLRKIFGLLGKLAITLLCFWYLARGADFAEIVAASRGIHPGWAALAVLLVTLQLPLVGMRWACIIDRLQGGNAPIPRPPVIAISSAGIFFSQVLPNLVSESVRIWLLTRLGRSWRLALLSVVIDRGVGLGTLCGIGFIVLLFPSALAALGGFRNTALALFGTALAGAGAALILARPVATLLDRHRLTRWPARLLRASHDVLLGSTAALRIVGLALLIHALTIGAVALLAQSLGLPLPVLDAAVLFVLMVGVSAIPVSIGGWGLREVAVTTLLGAHGMPTGQALFFSICFGVLLIIATVPGAVAWMLFVPKPHPSKARHGVADPGPGARASGAG